MLQVETCPHEPRPIRSFRLKLDPNPRKLRCTLSAVRDSLEGIDAQAGREVERAVGEIIGRSAARGPDGWQRMRLQLEILPDEVRVISTAAAMPDPKYWTGDVKTPNSSTSAWRSRVSSPDLS